MKKLQESYKKNADSMTSLAEGLAQIEVKIFDIELRTEEFATFKEQQGMVNVCKMVDSMCECAQQQNLGVNYIKKDNKMMTGTNPSIKPQL